MSKALYTEGYNTFKQLGEQPIEYIKQQHPMWRAGYRQAENEDRSTVNNASAPLMRIEQVERKPYKLHLQDIMGALADPRYAKVHREHMTEMRLDIIRRVEEKADDMHSFADVKAEVAKIFNGYLQIGYEDGILTTEDCVILGYQPQ